MTKAPSADAATSSPLSSRDWVRILANYRAPSTWRSIFELCVTLGPFIVLWAAAWAALSVSYWLTLAISILNGMFLVRLFIIQHDCGHRAFLANKTAGDWIGRVLGTLTLTPYDVWRRTHAIHHSHAGNLDQRGMGDVCTVTVTEYQNMSAREQLGYRLYRNPVILFLLGPIYLFYVQNRLPIGLMKSGWIYWTSAMSTNLVILVTIGVILWFGGMAPVFLIFLPTTYIGATVGLWMFYVQHQFEDTHWDETEDWQLHDAALQGSSHYVLPQPLQWLTGNIGIHHVHHLYNRIPFYRLTEVLRDHPTLAEAQRLTILESLSCINLRLWDAQKRKLLTYAEASHLYGPLKR